MTTRRIEGYRLRKAYPLEIFVELCGYFWDGSPVNNGYGCMHPEVAEADDNLGKCYAFACPLAYQQDAEGESDVVVTWRRTPDILPTLTPGNHEHGPCACGHNHQL